MEVLEILKIALAIILMVWGVHLAAVSYVMSGDPKIPMIQRSISIVLIGVSIGLVAT